MRNPDPALATSIVQRLVMCIIGKYKCVCYELYGITIMKYSGGPFATMLEVTVLISQFYLAR